MSTSAWQILPFDILMPMLMPRCFVLCRSLGDAELKADGLISAPEMTQRQLTVADEFLILASDGLWERMNNEQACGLVHDTVKEAGMAAKRYASSTFGNLLHLRIFALWTVSRTAML